MKKLIVILAVFMLGGALVQASDLRVGGSVFHSNLNILSYGAIGIHGETVDLYIGRSNIAGKPIILKGNLRFKVSDRDTLTIGAINTSRLLGVFVGIQHEITHNLLLSGSLYPLVIEASTEPKQSIILPPEALAVDTSKKLTSGSLEIGMTYLF